ncbi:aldose 1-epimerase [Kiloniella laminariae]|uniref:Aldose 1-epimerase n=1 Tax=Kiloniella laminariae TaxID=454162 RepID=A0ABT4LFD0_9PROT|nr:aldose 1-epimerase [Kiloniella laminariae]MCZ4279808.1 aldose 1-epimerase [Kiloniella laminariae]
MPRSGCSRDIWHATGIGCRLPGKHPENTRKITARIKTRDQGQGPRPRTKTRIQKNLTKNRTAMQQLSSAPITLDNGTARFSVTPLGGCLASYQLSRPGGPLDLLRPMPQQTSVAADHSAGTRPPEALPRDVQPSEVPLSEVKPEGPASFALIPYSNRLRDGRLNFAGLQWQLPLNFGDHPHSIHGIGWQRLWQVAAQEETAQDDNSITLELSHDPAHWRTPEESGWPFAFHASQTFTLTGADLRHEVTLTNRSDRPMPAGLGLHPYFPTYDPTYEGAHEQADLQESDQGQEGPHLQANVEAVWMTDATCLPTERIACPDHLHLRDGRTVAGLRCDNLFEPWDGQARITWPALKLQLDLSASADLDRLVVYAPRNKGYFCVEPVSHITDAFNLSAAAPEKPAMPPKDSGMKILAPGESWSVWMAFSPKELD